MRLSPSERVMVSAALTDVAIGTPILILGLLSGAASATSEAIRSTLLTCIDIFSLSMLLAVNRRKFSHFEFGIEKLQILVQIIVAIGMCISIVFIGRKIYTVVTADTHLPNYLFCVIFALFSYVNVLINTFNLRRMVVQERLTHSLIIRGQIKNRIVMLTSSVVATLSAAAVIIPDPKVFAIIDAVGAVLVLSVIVYTMVRMMGSGIMTLLDAPIDERDRRLVLGAVDRHAERCGSVAFVRTRRLGYSKYVEVGLRFGEAVGLEAALAVCRDIEAEILGRVGSAFVSVFPVGKGRAPEAAAATA
ncbi:MAG TPA: cation transporter [Kiloniellales bacterium]|nr:cation transporter [Kiloniellales bacterium]